MFIKKLLVRKYSINEYNIEYVYIPHLNVIWSIVKTFHHEL